MKSHLAKVSLALLSTVFLLGCQEQGSGAVGPEGLGPELDHKSKPHGGPGGGGGDKVRYSVEAVAGNCSGSPYPLWLSTEPSANSVGAGGGQIVWDPMSAITLMNGVELHSRGQANMNVHKGEISHVNFGRRDDANQVNYTTGGLTPDPAVSPLPQRTFIIEFNRLTEVFAMIARGNKRGPLLGTICVGELVFTPLDGS